MATPSTRPPQAKGRPEYTAAPSTRPLRVRGRPENAAAPRRDGPVFMPWPVCTPFVRPSVVSSYILYIERRQVPAVLSTGCCALYFFFSFVMKRCLDFCVCVDTAVLRRQGLSAHRPGWPCVMQLRTRRRDTTTHTYVRDTYVRAFRISVIILNRLIAWSLHAGAAPSYTTLFFFFCVVRLMLFFAL